MYIYIYIYILGGRDRTRIRDPRHLANILATRQLCIIYIYIYIQG